MTARAASPGPGPLPAELPAVIALVGDEERIKDRLLEEIVTRAGPDAARVSWNGEAGKPQSELSRLLFDLASRPLFGGCKVIVVRDGEGLLKRTGQGLQAALAIAAGNHLVLLLRALDNRTRLARQLKQRGGLIACVRPKAEGGGGPAGSELIQAVQTEAGSLGLCLDGAVALELAGRTGNDLLLVAAELSKLKLYLEDRNTVSVADVEALVPRSAGWDQFRLFQEVAGGDLKAALTRLRGMFDQGTLDRSGRRVTEPRAMAMTLLALLHNRIRLLARYRSLCRAGVKGGELQEALGIRNPGQLYYLSKEVQLPLVREAHGAVACLAEADRAIKTSQPAATVLERLIIRLSLLARRASRGRAAR
jgi:DNA polymerase III delta subunit